MSQQSFNEVHIYVENTEQKDIVRKILDKVIPLDRRLEDYLDPKIYTISWDSKVILYPNSADLYHLKPMVNLKELQEIVLLISLGIPAEEAISTITKQGYES